MLAKAEGVKKFADFDVGGRGCKCHVHATRPACVGTVWANVVGVPMDGAGAFASRHARHVPGTQRPSAYAAAPGGAFRRTGRASGASPVALVARRIGQCGLICSAE